MRLLAAIAGLAGMTLAPAMAQPAAGAYGKDWYEGRGWPGEYSTGFSMKATATLPMRAIADPAAPANLACKLNKNATYHPFNEKRVKSDKLEFVTYSRIVEYTVVKPTDIVLSGPNEELKVRMERGATWWWLIHIQEGIFEIGYRGREYQLAPINGGDKLLENSRSNAKGGLRDGEHKWMHVTCANGTRGWLFLAEVKKSPSVLYLEGPGDLVSEGEARDGPK